jgi:hypothetical protein
MSDKSQDDVKAISTLIAALKPLDQDARVHVLEFVVKRLGISLTGEPNVPARRTGTAESNPASGSPSAPPSIDMRRFALEKSPQTVNEKVAVIGYYLAHLAAERRDYLVSDDIETYFMQADFHLPAAPGSVTLANAKNAGYLSVQDRGRFKLSPVGYNLVAHKLPRGEVGEQKRTAAKKLARSKTHPKAKR